MYVTDLHRSRSAARAEHDGLLRIGPVPTVSGTLRFQRGRAPPAAAQSKALARHHPGDPARCARGPPARPPSTRSRLGNARLPRATHHQRTASMNGWMLSAALAIGDGEAVSAARDAVSGVAAAAGSRTQPPGRPLVIVHLLTDDPGCCAADSLRPAWTPPLKEMDLPRLLAQVPALGPRIGSSTRRCRCSKRRTARCRMTSRPRLRLRRATCSALKKFEAAELLFDTAHTRTADPADLCAHRARIPRDAAQYQRARAALEHALALY